MDSARSRSLLLLDSRSRGETTAKKPRLSSSSSPYGINDNHNGNHMMMSSSNDRDDDCSSYYSPQNLEQQQQQHEELVSQYKTALSELTFNSKPIITNLTIIAGENLLAAKAIAGTICANIIQVPSDQKLPSLYLLDSIVKNIGRDYIKYFGAKLPEVFCKAYRQVDASLHSGMRHLFGTWKGVFPPHSLHTIEKELSFTPAALLNAFSSRPTISRLDDSESQPHSIHVNPKYLEARQRLQSTQAKGTDSGSTGTLITAKDAERLDRASSMSGGRPWTDLPTNVQNIQRSQREVSRGYEKNTGSSYGDYEYGSEISRHSGQGSERDSERVTDQLYRAGRSVTEAIPKQRNGFDARPKVPTYKDPRVANADMQLKSMQSSASRSSDAICKSWKNSEEEEYMWDDLNSRLMDYGATNNSMKSRLTLDSEKLEFGQPHRSQSIHDVGLKVNRESSFDSLSTEQENQLIFSQRGIKPETSNLARMVIQPPNVSSHKISPGLSSTIGKQRLRTTGDPSPSLLARQPHQQLHNLAEQEHPQLNVGPRSKITKDTFSSLPQEASFIKSPRSNLQTSSLLIPKLSESGQAQKPPLSKISMFGSSSTVKPTSLDNLNLPSTEMPEQASTSSLLAAVLKSGILSKKPLTDLCEKKVEKPQLPPVSLPSSPVIGGAPSQISSLTKNVSNPLSNLLSSLVAKGLISSSETEPPTIMGPLIPITSRPVDSVPVCSPVSDTTCSSVASVPEPPMKTLPQNAPVEIKNLIGLEFKPDKIRKFNPSVISYLIDDLPHQCSLCGLRLKLQEQLDRHLEWHVSQKSSLNRRSRRWFENPVNLVLREESSTSDIGDSTGFVQESDKEMDMSEPLMVPADESQCICILCGELFEDFYCLERNEWMFKGAAYMTTIEGVAQDHLIVHPECKSDSSVHDLGTSDVVKMVASSSDILFLEK